MNKYILIAAASILFASCGVSNNVSDPYQNNPIHFTYNGHRYIYFSYGDGSNATGGTVHDPDCPCFKKYNK